VEGERELPRAAEGDRVARALGGDVEAGLEEADEGVGLVGAEVATDAQRRERRVRDHDPGLVRADVLVQLRHDL